MKVSFPLIIFWLVSSVAEASPQAAPHDHPIFTCIAGGKLGFFVEILADDQNPTELSSLVADHIAGFFDKPVQRLGVTKNDASKIFASRPGDPQGSFLLSENSDGSHLLTFFNGLEGATNLRCVEGDDG